jgi:hypothetical protein
MRYKIEVYTSVVGVYEVTRKFFVEACSHDEALHEARYLVRHDCRALSVVPDLDCDVHDLLFDAPGG